MNIYIYQVTKFTNSNMRKNSEVEHIYITNWQFNRNLVIATEYNTIIYIMENRTKF